MKVKMKYFLIAAFFSLFSTNIQADELQQNDLESFLQEIQQASDSVKSFQSLFTQEKNLALFSEPVMFSGRLALIRPEKLRWEFLSPIPSVLILNGDQGIRCTDQGPEETFQLSVDPIMKTVADQLWLWLGGNYQQLSKDYLLSRQGESTLLIEPKDQQMKEYVESIAIFFDKDSLQPAMVTIVESGGDLTRIRFTDGMVNQAISEQFFTRCDVE